MEGQTHGPQKAMQPVSATGTEEDFGPSHRVYPEFLLSFDRITALKSLDSSKMNSNQIKSHKRISTMFELGRKKEVNSEKPETY